MLSCVRYFKGFKKKKKKTVVLFGSCFTIVAPAKEHLQLLSSWDVLRLQ